MKTLTLLLAAASLVLASCTSPKKEDSCCGASMGDCCKDGVVGDCCKTDAPKGKK
jgi:hypothetical protein